MKLFHSTKKRFIIPLNQVGLKRKKNIFAEALRFIIPLNQVGLKSQRITI